MKTTRREFLAAAAAAPIVSPILMGVQDKSGTKLPVMGEGAHVYEAIHDWGELPPHIRWGNTHGVIEDGQGNVHVHHTVHATSESSDSMVVFDAKGRFVRSWGKELRGVAHGLHIEKEGRDEFLYLTANAANPRMSPQPSLEAAVVKTTLTGEIVWKIQGPPPDVEAYRPADDGTPRRYNPTNVAIAPNGDVYVADGYGSFFVNQYDRDAKYIRTFGGKGSDPGQLAQPHGIWIDMRGPTPVVVVADRQNKRVQRFTLDGKHIDFVSGFRLPCHFHERRGIVVVPDLHGRVTLMGRNNEILTHLGDAGTGSWDPLRTQSRDNFIPGQFICPHGAAFDHDGNIFVVEWVEVGRVTKLRKMA